MKTVHAERADIGLGTDRAHGLAAADVGAERAHGLAAADRPDVSAAPEEDRQGPQGAGFRDWIYTRYFTRDEISQLRCH